MPSLPPEMIVVLAPFAQLCSDRVWGHAQVLVLGALLAPGKRRVSSCLRVMGLAWEEHCTNYHQVWNRATWSALQASRILLGRLVQVRVPPGATLGLGAERYQRAQKWAADQSQGVLPRGGTLVA
jgi:hypothetical protein